MANFDAVWLPQWRRAETRASRAKKSKKKVCSDYLFENSCKSQSVFTATTTLDVSKAGMLKTGTVELMGFPLIDKCDV